MLIMRGQSVDKSVITQQTMHEDSTFRGVHIMDQRKPDDLWDGSQESLKRAKRGEGGKARCEAVSNDHAKCKQLRPEPDRKTVTVSAKSESMS